MTAIQLYKFVTENELEYKLFEEDILLFVNISNIEEWNEILGYSIKDESGIKCYMKDGYFVFYMAAICEYFDIELKEIFKKEG
jgi:hypothetical protein